MKILSKEDPQMWQQLQGFSDAASANFQPSTLGREGGEGRGGSVGSEERGSVEATLEDTLRRLRESTEQIEVWLLYETVLSSKCKGIVIECRT